MSDKELLERFVKCAPKGWDAVLQKTCIGHEVAFVCDGIGCLLDITTPIASGSAIMAMLEECKRIYSDCNCEKMFSIGGTVEFQPLYQAFMLFRNEYDVMDVDAQTMTEYFCNIREAYIKWRRQ